MTTWMVVEDEPDLYDMILAMYATLGIGGVAFVTGEEAIDWIEQVEEGRYNDELPQLAMIDIRLPDRVTGDLVGARLRRSGVLKNTVIVLMTAYKLSPEEEGRMITRAGADLLLYKPLPRLNELKRMLFNLIEERA